MGKRCVLLGLFLGQCLLCFGLSATPSAPTSPRLKGIYLPYFDEKGAKQVEIEAKEADFISSNKMRLYYLRLDGKDVYQNPFHMEASEALLDLDANKLSGRVGLAMRSPSLEFDAHDWAYQIGAHHLRASGGACVWIKSDVLLAWEQ